LSETRASKIISKYKDPTNKQLDKLQKIGYDGPVPTSKFHASEKISELEKPTMGQIAFLDNLGYAGVKPKNKDEASKFIDEQLELKRINKKGEECPKCKGTKYFEYGFVSLNECPYCDGTGLKEFFDEEKGDKIIADEEQDRW